MRGLSLSLFRYRYILELLAAALQLLLQPVAWYTLFLRSRWLLVLTIATLPSAYTYPWEWSLRIWFCTHGAVHWKRRGRMVEWEVVEWWDNRSIIERKDLRFLWLLRSAVRCPCVFGTQVWVWRHHRPIGNHALLCPQIKSRFARHQMGNVAIRDSVKSACIPSTLEPVGLLRNNGPRPGGVTISPWVRGKSLAWDFTCVHRLAASHLPLPPTKDPSSLTKLKQGRGPTTVISLEHIFSARRRRDTGRARRNNMDSIERPRKANCNADARQKHFPRLRQHLSIAVERGNAACISESSTHNSLNN